MKQSSKTAFGAFYSAVSRSDVSDGGDPLFNLCAAGIGRRTADIDCDGDRLQMGTVRLCGSEHPLSLVVADKEAAMMYAAFFGYYPVIKSFLESKLPRVFEWIVKFLIFNAAMVLAYLVIIFVFGMPLDEMEEFGRYAVPILLGMGNVVFFVYDIALTRVIGAYLHRWRKSFHRLFK